MLDALAACNTVAFDKTGTLTTGSLSCTGMSSPQESAADGDSSSARQGHGTDSLRPHALFRAMAMPLPWNWMRYHHLLHAQ